MAAPTLALESIESRLAQQGRKLRDLLLEHPMTERAVGDMDLMSVHLTAIRVSRLAYLVIQKQRPA